MRKFIFHTAAGKRRKCRRRFRQIIRMPVFLPWQVFQVWDRNQRQKIVKAFLEAEWASKAYLLISAPHTLIPDGFGEEIELIRVHPADLEDISQILKESLKNTPREWELLETAKQLKGLSESQIRGILRSLQGEYGISCGLEPCCQKCREGVKSGCGN